MMRKKKSHVKMCPKRDECHTLCLMLMPLLIFTRENTREMINRDFALCEQFIDLLDPYRGEHLARPRVDDDVGQVVRARPPNVDDGQALAQLLGLEGDAIAGIHLCNTM